MSLRRCIRPWNNELRRENIGNLVQLLGDKSQVQIKCTFYQDSSLHFPPMSFACHGPFYAPFVSVSRMVWVGGHCLTQSEIQPPCEEDRHQHFRLRVVVDSWTWLVALLAAITPIFQLLDIPSMLGAASPEPWAMLYEGSWMYPSNGIFPWRWRRGSPPAFCWMAVDRLFWTS